MPELVYPIPSKDLVGKQRKLAPETHAAFEAFSQTGVQVRRAAGKDQATYRGGGCTLTPVSLLHSASHKSRVAVRLNGAGSYGGDLGGGRDARPRCVCTFIDSADRI